MGGCGKTGSKGWKNGGGLCARCSWYPNGPRPQGKDLIWEGGQYCDQFGKDSTRPEAFEQRRKCVATMQKFKPADDLAEAIASLNLSSKHDIGVHLRGMDGGHVRFKTFVGCTDNNGVADAFANSIKLFDEKLGPDPLRRFYLASDKTFYIDRIKTHFKPGFLLTVNDILKDPKFKSLNPMALDIWALAQTSMLIGSPSTFSSSAAALGHKKDMYIVEHCNGGTTGPMAPENGFCAAVWECEGSRDVYDEKGKVVEVRRRRRQLRATTNATVPF